MKSWARQWWRGRAGLATWSKFNLNSLGGKLEHQQDVQDKFDEIEKIFAYNAGNALATGGCFKTLDWLTNIPGNVI